MKTTQESPWGPAQDINVIFDGCELYSTASHGGFLLNQENEDKLQSKVGPFKTFAGGPWYEEDCDACAVVCVFHEYFKPHHVHDSYRQIVVMAADWSKWHNVLERLREDKAFMERVRLAETELKAKWRRGSMASDKRGWLVWMRRGDERKTVIFQDYPGQAYYTDEELASVSSPVSGEDE